jgi:hypothetical protein
MFVSKAGACPSVTLGRAPVALIGWKGVEKHKHFSLIRKVVNYDRKTFSNTVSSTHLCLFAIKKS